MGAFPWELRVDGVNGGGNLFTLPTYAQAGTPYVLPESVSVSQAANGGGASISFEVIESLSIGSPWFALSTLNDNARVRFFDTRYSGSTPIALGYITSIDVSLLPNGVGTKASVTASDPTGWLEKIVVRKGKIGSATQQPVGNFTAAGTTDQQIITSILGYVNGATNGSYTQDAATKLGDRYRLLEEAVSRGSSDSRLRARFDSQSRRRSRRRDPPILGRRYGAA
jgi:hypothetical protein